MLAAQPSSPGAMEAIADWRRAFAVTDALIYLDHASVGPLPRAAVNAVTASLQEQARSGSIVHGKLHEAAEELRGHFARFVGAAPDQVAAVPSTAAGISTIAMGLDWRHGDNVVVPEIDFPSVVFPWMVLADRGVEVRRTPCTRGTVQIKSLLDSTNARTRVIAVSWVQFSSGFRTDLKELGEACGRRGILLVVDGMQGVGALRLNISSLPVDVLATQSYKWLLSPQGVGWLYIRGELLNRIKLSAAGVRTVGHRNSFLNHTFDLAPSARRFESGILNFHGMSGAAASLRMLSDIGIEKIESRVLGLSRQLAEGLLAQGCRLMGDPLNPEASSGIIVFTHPAYDAATCQRRLADAGIVVSVRENAVRISPHFYNTEHEIDKTLRILSAS